MEKTPNYNLKKPSQDDFYNIDDQNENADILDAEIKRVADKVDNLPKLPEDIARETTPKNIETKVTGIDTKIDTVDTVVDRIESDMNTIQNEITNSSTSYLGGQVQSIYNETTNSSTSYMNGQLQWLYNNYNGVIKSVQWGYVQINEYVINHNSVNVSKSFVILDPLGSSSGGTTSTVGLLSRNSTSFQVAQTGSSLRWFSWQLVEFY